MQIDKFSYTTIISTILFLLFFGCTSQEIVYAPAYALPKQIIPTNIDIQAKRQHMRNLKHILLIYNTLIDNIITYHPETNIDVLVDQLNKYIDTYVEPIFSDYDLTKSNESSIEIAKLYLVIASLSYKIGDKKRVRKYIKLFQTRYGANRDYFDLTLSSLDIGYSTLGEGIRELEKKVNLESALRHPR